MLKNLSEDNEADTTPCCAYCGISEVDEVKLKECDNCDLVRYCSDGKIINCSTKKSVRSEPLNYMMNFCSSNRKAPILGTVRFV